MASQQLLGLVLQSPLGGAKGKDDVYVAAKPSSAASPSAPRPDGPGAALEVFSVGRWYQALAR